MISYIKFDDNYNFGLCYDDRSYVTIANYKNIFHSTHANKYVRMPCERERERLEFYEEYNGKTNIYYSYPEILKKWYKTCWRYVYIFRSTLEDRSKYFLGVSKLFEIFEIKLSNHSYLKCFI